jgi:N-methylhydantoinase A
MGLVMSDVKHDYIRSRMTALARTDATRINAVFAELERQARTDLADEHFKDDHVTIEYALDMRYAGQGYEMTIPCPAPLSDGDLVTLRKAFDEEHRKTFGHTAPEEPVEIVSYRLRGVGRVPPVDIPRYEPTGAKLADALRETRACRFGGKTIETPVYQREGLDVGVSVAGPAIIDQLDCTTVLPPGQTAVVDAYKNLIIKIGVA